MIELAIAAAVGGALVATAVHYNLKARPVWKKFAAEAGFSFESAPGAVPRLRGHRRGFEVVIRGFGRKDAYLEILGVDPWFTFSPGSSRGSERALGDFDFDAQVQIDGDRDFAFGLLDAATRKAIKDAAENYQCEVKGEKLEAMISNFFKAPESLDTLLDLAERLQRPSSRELPPRLARNALEDPWPEFRLRTFRQLATEYYDAPEVLPTARRFLDAEQPPHQLEAARCLLRAEEDDRAAAAEVLADMVEQQKVPPELRQSALEALAESGQTSIAVRLSKAILANKDYPPMRRSAVNVLAGAGAIEELLALEVADYPAEAAALARGFGRLGDPRAQPRLLELLVHPDHQVKLATARALGTVGDARAVPPLRETAGSLPETKTAFDQDLEQALEQAVLQIQQRLGGQQAGEISIAVTEGLEGAVSPADDSEREAAEKAAGGEVSLAPEDSETPDEAP